jgi:hypothetical protein
MATFAIGLNFWTMRFMRWDEGTDERNRWEMGGFGLFDTFVQRSDP